MEYIAFIHGNGDTTPSRDEWDHFVAVASRSGLFRGGSAIGKRSTIGAKDVPDTTQHVGGYMRFDADSLGDLNDLLTQHPVVVHGGTIEICELPKT
jgi:hypothetical protein